MIVQEPQLSEFPSLQMVRTNRIVRVCARVTFTALIASMIGMVFIPWRQTASGIGTVVALDPQERPQPVRSPSKGIVKYVKPGLREGSFVNQGEVLIRLAPFAEDGVAQLDTQILAIESKESAAITNLSVAEQAEELWESRGERVKAQLRQDFEAAKKKWEQSKNEITALQAELEDKQNQARIAERVSGPGLVSGEELFSKRRAVETAKAKLLKAENAEQEVFAALQSKEEEIEAKRKEVDIKNREASQKVLDAIAKLRTIEKELVDLETKRDVMDRMEITAPRSGRIQQWYGLEGSDTIKEGDQLFVIVPEATELSVELKINGNDMPLIKPDDRVRLQFEGWPAVQFVGWPSVAVGTFGGKVNRVFPTDDGKGNFRVIVTADNHFEGEDGWPDSRYLRQGVRANGFVLLRQVPLGYEIWRQMNGFPPVVADEAPAAKDKEKSKVKLPKP